MTAEQQSDDMPIDPIPHVDRSSAIGQLAAALALAQGVIQHAEKDSQNPFFRSRYADLASVWNACRKPLSDNGLAVIQSPSTQFVGSPEFEVRPTRGGDERTVVKVITRVTVLTRLFHCSGEWVESVMDTLLPTGDPQSIGSAITYLRRYALSALVGVAPADDDAEEATSHHAPSGQPRPTTGPLAPSSAMICPACGKPAIIKSKAEYGGGWICFEKKGGCGRKFKDGDPDIASVPSIVSRLAPPVQEQIRKAFQALAFSPGAQLAKLNEFLAGEGMDLEAGAQQLLEWCRDEYARQRTGQPRSKADNGKQQVMQPIQSPKTAATPSPAGTTGRSQPGDVRADPKSAPPSADEVFKGGFAPKSGQGVGF